MGGHKTQSTKKEKSPNFSQISKWLLLWKNETFWGVLNTVIFKFKSAAVSKLEKKEINVLLSIFQEASKQTSWCFVSVPFQEVKNRSGVVLRSFLISYLVLHGNKDERRPENRDYKTLLCLSGRYTFISGNIWCHYHIFRIIQWSQSLLKMKMLLLPQTHKGYANKTGIPH